MDSRDKTFVLPTELPSLNNTLHLVVHESLKQRITMSYHLESLTKVAPINYIQDLLKKAKTHTGVFRIINKVCDACLLIGHNKKINKINNDITMMAIDEIELESWLWQLSMHLQLVYR